MMDVRDIIELFEYMEEHTNQELMEKIDELRNEVQEMRYEFNYLQRMIEEGKQLDFELDGE